MKKIDALILLTRCIISHFFECLFVFFIVTCVKGNCVSSYFDFLELQTQTHSSLLRGNKENPEKSIFLVHNDGVLHMYIPCLRYKYDCHSPLCSIIVSNSPTFLQISRENIGSTSSVVWMVQYTNNILSNQLTHPPKKY